MSEFLAFLHVGFRHIVDVTALDHILFLLALAAVYRFRDWREVLAVATAFTIGHSVTLVLAVTRLVVFPSAVIEFLIPLTILATGLENMLVHDRRHASWARRYRPLLAGSFGLIHGAGFANYLRSLFLDHIALPLFGFNVGIELGQLVVLALCAVALATVDAALRSAHLPARSPTPMRLRVLAVSSMVIVVAATWAVERRPW